MKAKNPTLVINMIAGVIKDVLVHPKRTMSWDMKREVPVAMIPTADVMEFI